MGEKPPASLRCSRLLLLRNRDADDHAVVAYDFERLGCRAAPQRGGFGHASQDTPRFRERMVIVFETQDDIPRPVIGHNPEMIDGHLRSDRSALDPEPSRRELAINVAMALAVPGTKCGQASWRNTATIKPPVPRHVAAPRESPGRPPAGAFSRQRCPRQPCPRCRRPQSPVSLPICDPFWMGHAMITRSVLLTFAVALLVSFALPALAQTKKDSAWGEPADLKPLMIPPVRPFLPPNSVLTPGPTSSGGSYSSSPLNDPTRDQATPGLRLTIPTR
jgi:hypothetical protein